MSMACSACCWPPGAERQWVLAHVSCALDDLVINVREVAHIEHIVAEMLQEPEQHIKCAIYAGMTCRRQYRE